MKTETISIVLEELHRMIWEESISKFVARVGLDANDLRIQCKDLGIPTPTSGYWSKKAFGKPVEVEPLPAVLDPKKIVKLKLKKEKKTNHLSKETGNLITSGRDVSNHILKHKTEHPLVQHTRDVFKQRKKRKPGDWASYENDKNFLAIQVQEANQERALRVFNTVLTGLNERGYQISTGDGSHTVVEVEEIKIPIRLREKNKRTLRKDTKHSWNEYDYAPTGILVFVSEYQSYRRKEYYDKPFSKLEEKTDQIIEDIIQEGIFETQQQKKWEIQRKIEKERKAVERKHRELVNAELKKFTALIPLQNRWHQARILREYLNAYEAYLTAKAQLTEERLEWLTWARQKADWFDPFVEREDEALKGVDRETLEPLKIEWYY